MTHKSNELLYIILLPHCDCIYKQEFITESNWNALELA